MNRRRPRSRPAWLLGVVVLVALGVAVVSMFRQTLRSRDDLSASVASSSPPQGADARGAEPPVSPVPPVAQGSGPAAAQALVQGVVLDPDGRPAASATVTLYRMVTGWPELRREPLATATTQGDGAFLFRTAVPYGHVLGFEREGFAGGLQQVPVGSGAVTLRLDNGFDLFGFVLNDSGTPVPNARVSVEAVPGEPRRAVSTRTAADGRYSFRNLAAGPVRLVAYHGSWQPAVAPTIVVGDLRRIDLRFDRPTMSLVRGHVVSASSQEPIADARVQLVPINLKLGLVDPIEARTAADGSFLLEGLPRGSVRLLVRHPEHGTVMRTQTIGAVAQDLPIELPARSVVEGQMVPELVDDVIRGGELLQIQDMAGEVQFATLDADGRFRFPSSLSPGWADLTFVAGELAFRRNFSASLAVKVVEAATTELELSVVPSTRVRGRFVDAGGAPVAGVRVMQTRLLAESARGIGDAAWQFNISDVGNRVAELFGAESGQLLAVSGDDGTFEIRGRAPGPLLARAEHDGTGSRLLRVAVAMYDEPTELGDIALPRGATILGRVLRGNRAFVGATVVAVGDDCHGSAVTDRSGVFVLRDLMPGTYSVRARIPGQSSGSDEQTVVVAPGATSRQLLVHLDVGRTVQGQVTGLDGQPVAGALITARGMPGLVAISDGEGNFVVELPPRPVELQVSLADRSRLRNVPVGLAEAMVRVQLDAPPTCSLELNVAGLPDRRRITGCLLRCTALDDAAAEERARWFEMPDGVLQWSQCPSGHVRLELRCDGFAPFVGEFELAANLVHRLDDVLLEPGSRLRGVVRDDQGQVVADAAVLLGEETDLDLFEPPVRSGADGSFVIQGVTSRSSRLVVRAPGYAPRTVDLNLPMDVLSPRPLEVVLERGATIEVRVAPDLVPDGGLVQLRRQGHLLATAELDDNGRAWFANRSAGSYTVRLFGHELPDRTVEIGHGQKVVQTRFQPAEK
ncbi:MAG: carboxypeptidase-like regulatory domain-containing protein [Planctomycetota bacterium]